tara:strand:- start:213 stop:428 length:216 start_codon:yes stop_codon:yes gene_type:complete
LVEKFLIYLTLLTNLFICSGVIRHWNNMPHQNSTMRAGACPYVVEPEIKSDKETKEKLEAKYKEPEGDPSY